MRLLVPLILAALLPATAAAQDFGRSLERTVERAAKSEVQRAADRETRRVTRCLLGDEACAREARARGDEVHYVESGAAAGATPGGGPGFEVSPYAGSRLRDERQLAFDAYPLVVGREASGDLRAETVEGRVRKSLYDNPGGRSTLEIARNYEQALRGRGLALRHQCAGRADCGGTGTREASWVRLADMNIGVGGDFRYLAAQGVVAGRAVSVAVMVNKQRHWVYVIEGEAMQTGQVDVSADALAAALASSGRTRLDGLYFDTGRASLRPASEAALAEVAALLRRDPSLRLEIVGHTDASGDADANQRLSERRALAVRAALVIDHGIADGRLRARGAGEGEPVADNGSEAGRALNRRVELVKQ